MNKKEQRRFFAEKRKQVGEKTRREKSDVIFHRIIESDDFIDCEAVFCYVSLSAEVDTYRLMNYILEKTDKRLAVPRCENSEGKMDFYYIKSMDMLEEGFFSVYEPAKCCEKAIPDDKTLCVVPGIAFDINGYRIGYGKGFYDRYFSCRQNFRRIGLCFSECLTDYVCHDENDVRVDIVITD